MKVVVIHHSSTGYRPQFYFRTTDVTGASRACQKAKKWSCQVITFTIDRKTLIAPIAMEEGLRFAIREGGRTVGAGVVAKSYGLIADG